MATGTDGTAWTKDKPQELEDDVAELVCHLAGELIQDAVFCDGPGPTEAAKQQFRDALNKLIAEQVDKAIAARVD